ncbi:hypothetical protein N184_28780 [Sinorhizobium sp. GL28]|nr:hypothetical protein N184_28780 [Sinorhizobium sp. GL28]
MADIAKVLAFQMPALITINAIQPSSSEIN